jgi:hypothetical protein
MKKLIIVLSVLIFSSLNAQTDSVKEALDYFPLHIGDYWRYQVTINSTGSNEPDTLWYGYKEVIRDTIMPNNKIYFMLNENNLLWSTSVYKYIRIDSTTADVYEYVRYYDPKINIYYYAENKIDSLLINKGDICNNYICTADTMKEYFGNQVDTKLLEYYFVNFNFEDGRELAKGFGEIMRYNNDISLYLIHYQMDLIYAKINGKEYGLGTDIRDSKQSPNQIKLLQNYPNPFNSTTKVIYELPKNLYVDLSVFNCLGETVSVLVHGYQSQGPHTVEFNSNNLASGIYFYRLLAGPYNETRRMIILK